MNGGLKIEKDVRFLNRETVIRCDEAKLEDGQLVLPNAEVELGDTTENFEFDEDIPFDDVLGEVAEQLITALSNGESGDDEVYGRDFDEPRQLKPDSHKAQTLELLYENSPSTSTELNGYLDFNYVSTHLSDLTNDGLVGVVTHHDRCNVYWPTSEGVKEVFALKGDYDVRTPQGEGLDSLFDDLDDDKEE